MSTWTCSPGGRDGDQYHDRAITNRGRPDLTPTQWWDENGIWQDGATMTRRPDGRFDVFLSKFSTQADRTDNDGHPA
ncbi:DUF2278 family protein [Streptomyces agglomeratus]|uniref:DUF2278 family protein n=1 Tax=Streptomyces agglomeratus TaxID=285458 RepID=UPI0009A06718